jgi:hypothetical protein
VTARARAALSAIAGFLRGFLGLARIEHEPGAARTALAERAARRRGCC